MSAGVKVKITTRGRNGVAIVRWAVRDGNQIELDPDRGERFVGAELRALLLIPGAEVVR